MPLFMRRSFLSSKPLPSPSWGYKSNQLQLNYLEHNNLALYRLISTLIMLLALCGYSWKATAGNFYAGLGGLASTTGGAGDAARLSTGSEATASLENLFLGWKSAQLLPQLGTDGLQVSVGRQTYKLGRGFLINGDGLSFGKGAEPDIENRGGAYYMAPRQSFANTLIIQLGQATSWQAQAFYLDSDNQA